MYLAHVARRVIFVVLFDDRSTLGLVRLKLRGIVDELAKRFEEVFRRAAAPRAAVPSPFVPGVPPRSGVVPGYSPALPAPADLLAGAEDEIDRLFG